MFYNFFKSLIWVYYHIFFRIEVSGRSNIPNDDGAIICPNHFSLNDPLVVAVTVPREIKFMAKSELFKNGFLKFFLTRWGAYPIKRGEPDLSAIKITLKALKEKKLVGLFPEGKRIKGEELGKANPGVALFSIKSGKPVIPTLISGKYVPFGKIKITFGQPLYFDEYKKEKMTNEDYLKLSQIVMQKIENLKRRS